MEDLRIRFIDECYDDAITLKENFKITESKEWDVITVLLELGVQIGHIFDIKCNTAKNNQYLDEYFKKTRLYEKITGKSYESTSNNDKVPVPLTDIERIFERIKLQSQRKIDTIIFPKINLNMGSSFKIEEMDTRKKYTSLDKTCFTPFDSESLRLEWIRKRKKNIDEITENKYDVIQEIIRDKQLLQLEYGPASNKKEIIEDIIR